jgi:hypothetical protein
MSENDINPFWYKRFFKSKKKTKPIKSIWEEIKVKRFSYIDLVWIAFIVTILKYYGL